MDLLTYAVSKKLVSGNEMWKYLHNNEPVPGELVADAFQDVLAQHQDIKAERLTHRFDEFISHHIPVTFQPSGGSITVSGEVDDNALEVLTQLHNLTNEAVVEKTIRSVAQTINPTQTVTIEDIQFGLSELTSSVERNHARVLDIVDEEPATTNLHIADEISEITHEGAPLDRAKQMLNTAIANDIHVEAPVELSDLPELEPFEEIQVTEDPFEDIEPVEDLPVLDDEPAVEEVTDAGVLKNVWNNFVASLREEGLDTDLELKTPLQMAI